MTPVLLSSRYASSHFADAKSSIAVLGAAQEMAGSPA